MTESEEPLKDPAAVAKRFNVCAETVRSWIRRGKLHAIRTPTGRYRIPESAITKLLAHNRAVAQEARDARQR